MKKKKWNKILAGLLATVTVASLHHSVFMEYKPV